MFGAVFLLFIFIIGLIALTKNIKHDYENRIEYSDKKTNTYLAYDGIYRDLDTGKSRFFYRRNGDRYMRGEDIAERNLSQEEREAEYQQYKQSPTPGRTTCFYSNEPLDISKEKRGRRYKDLETGVLYVVRRDKKGRTFYVDLDNHVVRYTDSFRKKWNHDDEAEAIKEFQEAINNAISNEYWKMDPTLIGNLNYDERDYWD